MQFKGSIWSKTSSHFVFNWLAAWIFPAASTCLPEEHVGSENRSSQRLGFKHMSQVRDFLKKWLLKSFRPPYLNMCLADSNAAGIGHFFVIAHGPPAELSTSHCFGTPKPHPDTPNP